MIWFFLKSAIFFVSYVDQYAVLGILVLIKMPSTAYWSEIGLDVLRQFNVLVDYKSSRAIL